MTTDRLKEIIVIRDCSPHIDHIAKALVTEGFEIVILDEPAVVLNKLFLLSRTPKLIVITGIENPSSLRRTITKIRSIAQFRKTPLLSVCKNDFQEFSRIIDGIDQPLEFVRWPSDADILTMRANNLVELSEGNLRAKKLQNECDKLVKKHQDSASSEMCLTAINELSSAISNQLMGIRSVVDRENDQMNPANYKEHINDIRVAVLNMAKLLREIESLIATPLLDTRPVHIAKLVNQFVHRIIPSLPNGTTLKSRIDSGLWMTKGDYNQLESAIAHLVSNAIEAIGNDGTVSINATNVRVTKGSNTRLPIPEGEYIRITVKDTGTGITEEDQAKVFTPLYTTKSTNGPWRGLGLAQVRAIAHRHGGHIHLISFPDKGSEFSLLVPRSRQSEIALVAGLAEARESIRAPKRLTVLIVDDEPMILRSIQSILKREGHRSFSEVYGRAALNFYKQYAQEIDVIILDIRLMDTTGFDVANEVFSINPNAKIIFTSGAVAAPPRFGEINMTRTTSFLRKPFESEDLIRAIYEVLNPNRASLQNASIDVRNDGYPVL